MSRKSVVGLELEGNLCTKLPKLASFCCRHEWGAREIENSFKFVQYKRTHGADEIPAEKPAAVKIDQKNMDEWVTVRSSKHC